MGCDRQGAKIPSVPALPANDSLEGKLARVMQRLDSALESAAAASGSGVISERRAYEKLVPPAGENGQYTAIIYLETTRALAPLALNAAAKAKVEAEAKAAGEESAEGSAKSVPVQDSRQVETDEYPLVFEGDRWKLVNEIPPPPAGEPLSTEKILFDYALDAN
jgi:hypothetical protein